MAKTRLSPAVIRNALKHDERFQAYGEDACAAMEKYLVELPSIVKAQLDQQVTLASLYQCRFLFLKYQMDNDIIPTLLDAMGGGFFSFMMEAMRPMFESIFKTMLKEAKSMAKNWKKAIEKKGQTEREALIEAFGLNEDALAQYDAGELTIADLIAIQPMAIMGYPKFNEE